MEVVSGIFDHILFYLNIFFGAVVNLIFWAGISLLMEKIAKKGKSLGIIGFIGGVFFSFILSKAVYHWGVQMHHFGISTPGFYETDAEAQSKAAGFGNGYYYANWVFTFLALFIGVTSLFPAKEVPENLENKNEHSEKQIELDSSCVNEEGPEK